jgi:hypothetical protein
LHSGVQIRTDTHKDTRTLLLLCIFFHRMRSLCSLRQTNTRTDKHANRQTRERGAGRQHHHRQRVLHHRQRFFHFRNFLFPPARNIPPVMLWRQSCIAPTIMFSWIGLDGQKRMKSHRAHGHALSMLFTMMGRLTAHGLDRTERVLRTSHLPALLNGTLSFNRMPGLGLKQSHLSCREWGWVLPVGPVKSKTERSVCLCLFASLFFPFQWRKLLLWKLLLLHIPLTEQCLCFRPCVCNLQRALTLAMPATIPDGEVPDVPGLVSSVVSVCLFHSV